MTDNPTPPPAGWYPATDGSTATWWWDGQQWAQPQHPAQSPVSTSALTKLAAVTQVLLIVCGVLSFAIVGVEVFGIIAASEFINGQATSIAALETYDLSTTVTSSLSSIALIATGVLWAIWQYRAAKSVVGLTRRSPGWHAGSWFIPVVSFWFAYQNVSDLWRAVGRARPSWMGLWWFFWIGSNVIVQISTRSYLAAEELEELRTAMSMSLVGELFAIAAVPFAWLTVRGITQGILQRSTAAQVTPAA